MGWELPVDLGYEGMTQDYPRNQLPPGRAWNMIDYLPNWNQAPLTKRGGWQYYSAALANTYLWKTDFAPYTTASHQVTFTDTGQLFFDATSKGTQIKPFQTAFLKDLFFYTDSTQGSQPRTINASGVSASVASAPRALYAAAWGERMLAGNVSGSSRYLYFSAPNDPTSWSTTSTTGAYFALTRPIKGLAVANGIIICFSDGGVERLVGTNPPPGGNLARRWLADHGCIDWRSIANWGQYAVWADIDGIYLTDGSTVTDMTLQAGMKEYWIQNVMGSWTSSYTVAGGIYQDKYVVCVMNGATPVDSLIFDMNHRSAYRISNLSVTSFSRGLAGASGAADELYASHRATNRILALNSMWNPSATYKADGDGTSVTPIVETPFLGVPFSIPGQRRIFTTSLGPEERIRNVYLGYDMRDSASDNPTLTVGYCTDPDATSYTSLTPTYTETTAYVRKRLPVRKQGRGFGFKISQTNASASTELHTFGYEGHVHQTSQ